MKSKVVIGSMAGFIFLVFCYYMGQLFVPPTADERVKQVSFRDEQKASRSKDTIDPKTNVKKKNETKTTYKKSSKPKVNTQLKDIPFAEQKLLNDLQAALDDDNFENLAPVAEKLIHSGSVEARLKVVEALGWFKLKSLPLLRSMLTDVNSEVARDAADQWSEAAEEILDEHTKAEELYSGMLKITDEESLDACIMDFYSIDDGLALEYIVKLIHSGNDLASRTAREGYEHITGEGYTDTGKAQQWIDEWRTRNPLEPIDP